MNFLESVYYDLYENVPDSSEVQFYWDILFKDIELYADPAHKGKTEEHFYGIVCRFGAAERMQGFKRGISLILELVFNPKIC